MVTNKIKYIYSFMSIRNVAIVIATLLFILSFFIPDKYNLYDYLKAKRLEYYYEQQRNKVNN